MSEPCQHERTADLGDDPDGDLDEIEQIALAREAGSGYRRTAPTPAGSAEDVEALAEWISRWFGYDDGPYMNHGVMARSLLASDWLAAHTARALADDRERLARVEALADEWDRRQELGSIPRWAVASRELRATVKRQPEARRSGRKYDYTRHDDRVGQQGMSQDQEDE